MKCPSCNTELKMSDRQGIEIDYCPECRGVWLDRGELDKIIERTQAVLPSSATPSTQPYASPQRPPEAQASGPYREYKEPNREYDRDDHRRYDDDDYSGRDYRDRDYDPRKGKRKSFLSDIFDFD